MHNGILLTLVTFSLLNQDPSIVLRLAALAGGWRLTAELRMLMMGIAVCVGSCWQMDWQSACVVGVGMGLLGELGLVGGLGVVLFLAAIKTASDVLLTVTFCIYLGLYCSYLTRQIPVVLSHSQSLSQRVSTLRREQSTLQAQLHLEKFQNKPLAERRASRILSKLTDLGRPVTGQSADINLYTEESPVMVDSGLSLPSEDSIDETHRIDLTSDDLDLLVNSVISRETGKWSEQQLKAVSDIFAERLDLRDALSQKLEEAAGSSQRVFKPLPKQKITVREVVLDGAGLLSTVGDWNFDTLSAVQHTQEPLKEIGFTVFRICGLCEEFDIPREKLLGFLTRIEAKYLKENYYHNSVHAADVLNSALHLLMSSLHSLGCFLSVEVFALLVAAIGHDVKHPGFNNSFLIATQDPLALRYNDRSVLEMMHCSLTFQVLERPDSAVTAGLNPPTYMTFRKFVISLILTTDLQKHMSKVKELREYVEDEGKTLLDPACRLQAMELCIMCADLGHGAKQLAIHLKWSSLVLQEFFAQGDKERQLDLPVSPLCDRNTAMLPQVQSGFLSFLVTPVFELWERLTAKELGDIETVGYVAQVKSNTNYWRDEASRVESGLAEYRLSTCSPPLLPK